MKALEDLEAAFAAATQGEWLQREVGSQTPDLVAEQGKGWNNPVICNFYEDVTPEDSVTLGAWYEQCNNYQANAHLIALMHNNLPALIECAEALEYADEYLRSIGHTKGGTPECVRRALAKLQGVES